MWPEIQQVQEHDRHELVLSGADVNKKIEENGLDEHLYALRGINFLEISRTALAVLDDRLGQLGNLTKLVLRNNRLTAVPDGLKNLIKLKFLDVSQNQLSELPNVFGELVDLHSLNASGNVIDKVADLSNCKHLTYVDLSFNKLSEIPPSLLSGGLTSLLEVKLNSNIIQTVDPGIATLPGLKQLDLSSNQLTALPKELASGPKLKEVILHDNPLKDQRLKKLCAQSPPKFKAILEYIHINCPPAITTAENPELEQNGVASKSKKGKGAKKQLEDFTDVIRVVPADDTVLTVKSTAAVQQVRPYIVCCILRNMELQDEKLKKFLSIQTNLHDELCDKRTLATIATHDLGKVKGGITYDAQAPSKVRIHPLRRPKEVGADELMSQLMQEAETLRKEKKRNTFSGIHKYLNLLHEKPVYPFLRDSENTVISFPPITNSDDSKISADTANVLVEVTSSKSLAACKTVMEKIIQMCLKEGVVTQAADAGDGQEGVRNPVKLLIVQQVRVLDESGNLKVVYPSKVDLQFDQVTIQRDGE